MPRTATTAQLRDSSRRNRARSPAAIAPASPGSREVCSEVNTNSGTRAITAAASSAPTTAGLPGDNSRTLITAALMSTWASSIVPMSSPSRWLIAAQGSGGPGRTRGISGPRVNSTASSGATARMSPNATAEWLPARPSAHAAAARRPPSIASWAPYPRKAPRPASVPRLTAVTASATQAQPRTVTIAVSPPNRRSASGPAAAASGTRITASTRPDSRQARRTTGAIPSPTVVRAATSLISSCSTGRNTPRPSRNTMDQSTDRAAMPEAGRLWPATARWA